MDVRQVSKLVALTDANQLVRDLATASDSPTQEWQFFCECGRPDCRTLVTLTLAEYERLKDGGGAILASGHLVDEKERSRVLREHATALRAQARHQFRRAEKNLGRDT